MKTLLLVFLLVASPVAAQVPGGDFHAWFLSQVAGKPFTQQTLVELQPALACVGSALTPPNAVGERTKIFDPIGQAWTRVGFGEGQWVWIAQGDGAPPIPQPCNSSPTSPDPHSSPTTGQPVDLTNLYARLDSITAQNERIFANLNEQLQQLRLQVKAHDDKPGDFEKVFGNKYVQIALGALGTCVSTQCWK